MRPLAALPDRLPSRPAVADLAYGTRLAYSSLMRTTLDLDDRLLEVAAARHPGRSKTDLIEEALRAYLANDAAQELRRLAGYLEIEDVSAETRDSDRHT